MDWTMYVKAFAIGGLICLIAQILVIRTKITPARILVIFLIAGIVLETFGLYDPILKFAGAGASVPITGFGALLAKGSIEAAMEKGVLGAFTGGMTIASAGLSAAIIFSYFIALIFNSKSKKR